MIIEYSRLTRQAKVGAPRHEIARFETVYL
jgi:hypothetical protein